MAAEAERNAWRQRDRRIARATTMAGSPAVVENIAPYEQYGDCLRKLTHKAEPAESTGR